MVDRDGYGKIRDGRKTGRALAHRVAWVLAFGPIPDGMCVCHRCDNPPCCNTAHMFLGDTAANMKDRLDKGRFPVGSAHANSKLTESDAAEIHELRRALWTYRAISERYGVSEGLIRHVIKGRAWVHVKPQ